MYTDPHILLSFIIVFEIIRETLELAIVFIIQRDNNLNLKFSLSISTKAVTPQSTR